MRKGLAILIAVILLATMIPLAGVSVAADSTLSMKDRTGTYKFQVGETFTYSFWLHLRPDLMSADAIETIKFSGNVRYDDTYLQLEEAVIPNFHAGKCIQKNDALAGTLLDGTLMDLTDDSLYFTVPSAGMTDAEKGVFNKTNIMITCTFRVKQAGETEVVTRIKSLDVRVAYNDAIEEWELVEDDTSNYVYDTYETINNEKPTERLDALIQDVGMDIRFTDDFTGVIHRPGAGVVVTLIGTTAKGKAYTQTTVTKGEDVAWFYDVPYGGYYVECSFRDDNGTYYATIDPEKQETICVPATGRVQALWLLKADASTQTGVNIDVTWKGENGDTSKRPSNLYACLKAKGVTVRETLIDLNANRATMVAVDIYDSNDNVIDYQLEMRTTDKNCKYSFTVTKETNKNGDINFHVVADAGKSETSQNGGTASYNTTTSVSGSSSSSASKRGATVSTNETWRYESGYSLASRRGTLGLDDEDFSHVETVSSQAESKAETHTTDASDDTEYASNLPEQNELERFANSSFGRVSMLCAVLVVCTGVFVLVTVLDKKRRQSAAAEASDKKEQ